MQSVTGHAIIGARDEALSLLASYHRLVPAAIAAHCHTPIAMGLFDTCTTFAIHARRALEALPRNANATPLRDTGFALQSGQTHSVFREVINAIIHAQELRFEWAQENGYYRSRFASVRSDHVPTAGFSFESLALTYLLDLYPQLNDLALASGYGERPPGDTPPAANSLP